MSKIINDSIHGHVVVPEIVVKIIDTPQFQRLRRVKQTGASHYIYPDATHTRFSHSIGVCHLARLMGETLQKSNSDITSKVLAIFSPNFVQVGKGRDQKMVFCRVRHKKCRARGETFLCQIL